MRLELFCFNQINIIVSRYSVSFFEDSCSVKMRQNFQKNRARLEIVYDSAPPQEDILEFCN